MRLRMTLYTKEVQTRIRDRWHERSMIPQQGFSSRVGETVEEGHRMPRESSQARRQVGKAKSSMLVFRPLTPGLMDEFGTVLRGNWGAGCWCTDNSMIPKEL